MIERREGDEAGFRTGTVLGVALVAAVLAAASLYFAVQNQPPVAGERATTSTSYSALGFRGFAELLAELGFPVTRSRRGAGLAADRVADLAVLPAPRSAEELGAALDRHRHARAVLIVAPKRVAVDSPDPRNRVRRTRLLPASQVEGVLRAAAAELILLRPPAPGAAPGLDGEDVRPAVAAPQLVRHPTAPAVAAYPGDGKPAALLLELQADRPRIWLLADPDPLANHGLDEGDNALFAARLVEALAGPGATVLFDEAAAVDGAAQPSAFARLFRLPWLALTLALAALGLAVGLAAANRFGTPKEVAAGVAAGRASLIGATARLQMDRAGARAALGRYMRRTLRHVAQRRHAPAGDDAALADWLDGVRGGGGQRRGAGEPAAAALLREAAETAESAEAGEARILAVARRIHGWRMDMLNEHSGERPARPHPGRGR
jgi:hypothetical protein